MKFGHHASGVALTLAAAVALSVAGCNQDKTGGKSGNTDAQAKAKVKGDAEEGKHSGWWCEEHGVPEHMCSLCSSRVASKCKKDGDWCKLHERADSQCFKCDPSKYAKFEQMYEAKYGKKPPRPPEEEFQK